jgi:hypothetical protein
MYSGVRFFILIIFFGAALVMGAPASAANCNKNPDHPQCGDGEPPTPPPTGSDCETSDGVFPALAYKTETVTGKRRNQKTTTDIFVANSTSSCTIKVFTTDVGISDIRYKQGSNGINRIVWSQENSVGSDFPTARMIQFSTAGKIIKSGLPLAESTVYSVPVTSNVGIGAPILSDNASLVVFSVEESDGQGGWLDHINISDISNCLGECPTTRVLELSNQGIFPFGDGLALNSTGERIFFGLHDRIADVHKLSFIENQGGTWSAPVDVVTDMDTGYSNRSFRELDAGLSATGDEIVAVHYEENGAQTAVKILSTANCTVDPMRSASCFSAGLSGEVAHIPYVAIPTFTNTPFGSTASPSLAIQAFQNGSWVLYNAELSGFSLEPIPNMPNQRITIGD